MMVVVLWWWRRFQWKMCELHKGFSLLFWCRLVWVGIVRCKMVSEVMRMRNWEDIKIPTIQWTALTYNKSTKWSDLTCRKSASRKSVNITHWHTQYTFNYDDRSTKLGLPANPLYLSRIFNLLLHMLGLGGNKSKTYSLRWMICWLMYAIGYVKMYTKYACTPPPASQMHD